MVFKPMGPAVEVHDLRKSWKALWTPAHEALRGVSLTIGRGVAFGLIGPNGAGKTTFIKVLLGVARAAQGSVRVLGGDPEDTAIRARIGYLPERLHLPTALTARNVLRSMATLKRLHPSDGELQALLARVGLPDSSQRVGAFSKGMRQRLGLATALLGAPELLILDEPTDGIDPLGRVEVRELLLAEKRRGATILLNSHLLSETERVCDRIGILNRGQLVLEASIDEVRQASTHWFLRVGEHPAAAEVLGALGCVSEGSGFRFAGGDLSALNRVLDGLRQRGLELVELAPATRDLETVLAQTLAQGGEARP
jgi:ABC-2 type transport system ATP-binding protein